MYRFTSLLLCLMSMCISTHTTTETLNKEKNTLMHEPEAALLADRRQHAQTWAYALNVDLLASSMLIGGNALEVVIQQIGHKENSTTFVKLLSLTNLITSITAITSTITCVHEAKKIRAIQYALLTQLCQQEPSDEILAQLYQGIKNTLKQEEKEQLPWWQQLLTNYCRFSTSLFSPNISSKTCLEIIENEILRRTQITQSKSAKNLK